MGMIYKRKTKNKKTGEVREGKTYWIKYYQNGKPLYESSKCRKESDARKLLKKREGEISEGKLPGIYFDRVKFDELAEDLVTDYEINGRKSLAHVKIKINNLKECFEGVRVTEITTPRINLYIKKRMEWACNECQERFDTSDECPSCGSDDLNPGVANATINRELSALKRMLNIGARQTPPKVDRVPYIPMLKENNVRKGFFEHDDYLSLLEVLPAYLKPVSTFGYNIGWRKSEITGLTWDRVDLKEGTVRLEPDETKNEEGRTVYLNEELLSLLRSQLTKRRLGCKYVFHNDGEKLKKFSKAWRAACKKAAIEGKLFHDFRRTAIRNMIRAGINESVTMKISGHKTRAVFDRYNIVSPNDLKLPAQKIAEYHSMVTKKVTIGENDGNVKNTQKAQVIELI